MFKVNNQINSDQLSLEEVTHKHECLNCNHRNQRFSFDIPKKECVICIKKSNFKEREVLK